VKYVVCGIGFNNLNRLLLYHLGIEALRSH